MVSSHHYSLEIVLLLVSPLEQFATFANQQVKLETDQYPNVWLTWSCTVVPFVYLFILHNVLDMEEHIFCKYPHISIAAFCPSSTK